MMRRFFQDFLACRIIGFIKNRRKDVSTRKLVPRLLGFNDVAGSTQWRIKDVTTPLRSANNDVTGNLSCLKDPAGLLRHWQAIAEAISNLSNGDNQN